MKTKRYSRFTLAAAGMLLALSSALAPVAVAAVPRFCTSCVWTTDYSYLVCTTTYC